LISKLQKHFYNFRYYKVNSRITISLLRILFFKYLFVAIKYVLSNRKNIIYCFFFILKKYSKLWILVKILKILKQKSQSRHMFRSNTSFQNSFLCLLSIQANAFKCISYLYLSNNSRNIWPPFQRWSFLIKMFFVHHTSMTSRMSFLIYLLSN
jgi:hypothetical protein